MMSVPVPTEQNVVSNVPHRRYNPLLDQWLIVAPQRCARPWQGQTESSTAPKASPSDTNTKLNPLQPGGLRANGVITADYSSTYVFANDFPALLPTTDTVKEHAQQNGSGLLRSERVSGECRVMCYHPDSTQQLATMCLQDVLNVIEQWATQTTELGTRWDWVQVFENKGAIVGCSNPHPHCQIWASSFLPSQVLTEQRTQSQYKQQHNGQVMLLDYLQQELASAERLVLVNEHWVWLVPYWAVWPYETLLLPREHVLRLDELSAAQRTSLADIMQQLLGKYDRVFGCSMPYSMAWKGAPTGQYLETDQTHWQLHAVYLPPLLRSATVKKFMAGYELVAEPQRDLTPEMAAQHLRKV